MRILISVADPQEAELALSAGISWLDLKDPKKGSLGAAEIDFQKAVIKQSQGSDTILSVACGELDSIGSSASNVLPGFQFAKLGISGLNRLESYRIRGSKSWQDNWQNWAKSLPEGCRPVVVCYADDWNANGLTIAQAIRFASQVAAPYVLIDTFDKNETDLFDAIGRWTAANLIDTEDRADFQSGGLPPLGGIQERIKSVLQLAAKYSLQIVWAGRLKLTDAELLKNASAAVVGFRSAVCAGDRKSKICTHKLGHAVALEDRSPDQQITGHQSSNVNQRINPSVR